MSIQLWSEELGKAVKKIKVTSNSKEVLDSLPKNEREAVVKQFQYKVKTEEKLEYWR